MKMRVWGVQHRRDDPFKHVDGQQADLLELADFAEIGDANSQIGKGAMLNDLGKILLVEPRDDVEGRTSNFLCKECQCAGSNAPRGWRTCENFRRRGEYTKHCPPTGSQVVNAKLYHLLQTLQDLDEVPVPVI